MLNLHLLKCMVGALEWLDELADDPYLAFDTRVSVPIFVSQNALPDTPKTTL